MPDEIVYGRIFHHIARLKHRADDAQQQGKELPGLAHLVQKQAGLGDYEATVLEQIALQCETDVAAQDAKAKVVRNVFKAQFPQGLVPRGVKLPPPSPELAQMWQERNAIILLYRDRLRNALGEESFAKFDAYVKTRVTQNLKSVTPVAGQ